MNSEIPNKPGRGGARVGSGPKKKPDNEKKVQLSVSLSPEVVAAVKSACSSPSKYIENLLREKFGI